MMIGSACRPISVSALRECAIAGLCQREAADALGISLSTFKNRLTDSAELREVWRIGAAAAKKRAEVAMGVPTKWERRFHINLRAALAEKIRAKARAEGVTPHAIIVRALERELPDRPH